MNDNPVFIDKNELDKLADESGLAIVFVNASKDQVASANDNSICRNLNPDGRLVGQCSHFCGTALEEATEVEPASRLGGDRGSIAGELGPSDQHVESDLARLGANLHLAPGLQHDHAAGFSYRHPAA